jgi:hypothetical protein
MTNAAGLKAYYIVGQMFAVAELAEAGLCKTRLI